MSITKKEKITPSIFVFHQIGYSKDAQISKNKHCIFHQYFFNKELLIDNKLLLI